MVDDRIIAPVRKIFKHLLYRRIVFAAVQARREAHRTLIVIDIVTDHACISESANLVHLFFNIPIIGRTQIDFRLYTERSHRFDAFFRDDGINVIRVRIIQPCAPVNKPLPDRSVRHGITAEIAHIRDAVTIDKARQSCVSRKRLRSTRKSFTAVFAF